VFLHVQCKRDYKKANKGIEYDKEHPIFDDLEPHLAKKLEKELHRLEESASRDFGTKCIEEREFPFPKTMQCIKDEIILGTPPFFVV